MNNITNLPAKIVFKIQDYLPTNDNKQLACANRAFRTLAQLSDIPLAQIPRKVTVKIIKKSSLEKLPDVLSREIFGFLPKTDFAALPQLSTCYKERMARLDTESLQKLKDLSKHPQISGAIAAIKRKNPSNTLALRQIVFNLLNNCPKTYLASQLPFNVKSNELLQVYTERDLENKSFRHFWQQWLHPFLAQIRKNVLDRQYSNIPLMDEIFTDLPPLTADSTEVKKWLEKPTLLSSLLFLKGRLESFKHIKLESIDLPIVPSFIYEKMNNLVVLNLSKCNLEQLSENIGGLVKLQKLNLSHNKLKSLPNIFSKLPRLIYLDCEDNDLRQLPQSLQELTACFMDFTKNPKLVVSVTAINKIRGNRCAIQTDRHQHSGSLVNPADLFLLLASSGLPEPDSP